MAILVAVSLASAISLALAGPVAQPPGYHSFADRTAILGIPGFWNVISNLAFVIGGGLGLGVLLGSPARGALPALRPAWFCLFTGAILVGAGSARYHLAPSNDTLAWDRLPMAVAFAALLVIVLGEQVSPAWAARLLPLSLLAGAGSVFFWRLTGDLRPYILVQYLPLLLIPLALLLFKPPLCPTGFLWAGLLAYGLAKVFEILDVEVYRALGWMGGHPMKHVMAGLAVALLALAALRRRPLAEG